jgi:hypothetical protein
MPCLGTARDRTKSPFKVSLVQSRRIAPFRASLAAETGKGETGWRPEPGFHM